MWNRTGRPAPRTPLLVAGLLIAVGAVWWFSGSDERRVNAACGTYLEHRDSLRAVLTESDEAVGRATAAKAGSTVPYFNEVDRVDAWVEQWMSESPRVIDSLDQGDDASSLERGAVSSFTHVESGLTELRALLEDAAPAEVAQWLPEVAARLQNVDDVCLSAARSR